MNRKEYYKTRLQQLRLSITLTEMSKKAPAWAFKHALILEGLAGESDGGLLPPPPPLPVPPVPPVSSSGARASTDVPPPPPPQMEEEIFPGIDPNDI